MSAEKKETKSSGGQKFFVDSREVIRYRPGHAGPKQAESSAVIRKEQGRVSEIRVPMNKPAPPPEAQIEVQIQRKGPLVNRIRIMCPCGRHAEVDLDYPTGASEPGKGSAK